LLKLSGLGFPADAVTQVRIWHAWHWLGVLYVVGLGLCSGGCVIEIGGWQLFAKADTNQDGKLQVSTTLLHQ
jgi:hypothetical protein